MNYYEHHLGDYDGATAHLSWLEDCAYRRLICLYYRNEKPIPADIKQACRLVRAASKQEREAVQQVLEEFFELQEDGWHHARCDAEIAKYLEAEPEREARRANQNERQRRSRARRAELFELLRGHDIVPPFDTKTSDLEAMLSRASKRDESRGGHAPVTRDITATQSPDPIPTTQEPISSKPLVASKPSTPAKAKFDYATGRFENLSSEMLQAWAEAYPAIDVRQEIAKAKAWLLANPKNRKSNLERFLTNWLTKAQDRTPPHGQPNQDQFANGRGGSANRPQSAADRVRDNNARERAAEAAAAAGTGTHAVGGHDPHVRPQVGESVRGPDGSGERLGGVLEGCFERAS